MAQIYRNLNDNSLPYYRSVNPNLQMFDPTAVDENGNPTNQTMAIAGPGTDSERYLPPSSPQIANAAATASAIPDIADQYRTLARSQLPVYDAAGRAAVDQTLSRELEAQRARDTEIVQSNLPKVDVKAFAQARGLPSDIFTGGNGQIPMAALPQFSEALPEPKITQLNPGQEAVQGNGRVIAKSAPAAFPVAPGSPVYVPGQGFVAPPDEQAVKPNAQINDYNLAKKQGFTGTLQDWLDRNRGDKASNKPVIGVDSNSKQVLVNKDDAERLGLKSVVDAPSADVSKALASRSWIPLAASSGDTPDQMGILQLIDKLDQRGALGPIASRWNDFMVGQYGGGTGDPETDRLIEALRTKVGLSQTLLMNAHVGQRGGSYMLEKFEDLANSRKLNANSLKTGVQTELNYVRDRAMLPSGGGGSNGSAPDGTVIRLKDGTRSKKVGGQWQPIP